MKGVYRYIAIPVIVAAVLTACKEEDYFDKDRYQELIGRAFPVAQVDPQHDWTLAEVAGSTAIRYCFEEDFPQEGDYDFNDVVLTLMPVRNGSTVNLQVTLDAVGGVKQTAGAIRVKGVSRDDVAAVSVRGDFDFDNGKPLSSYMIIDSKEPLLPDGKKRTQDIVINLFSDAHWAMGRSLMTDGSVRRWMYNTVAYDDTSRPDRAYVTPVSVTYTIELTSEAAARRFCAENLDAFIIENYNGIYMEVHTFPFKTDEVIYEYMADKAAYADNYIWALQVPASFCYPAEGTVIGSDRSGTLTGAYQMPGHSFAEWAADRTKATDWYKYPSAQLIYR